MLELLHWSLLSLLPQSHLNPLLVSLTTVMLESSTAAIDTSLTTSQGVLVGI